MSSFKWFLRREPKILQFLEASTDFDLFFSPSGKESLSLVSSSQLKRWDRALTKLLVKILLRFLFTCNLLLFKCCGKIFYAWLMKCIFLSAHSCSKFLLNWAAFSLNLSLLTAIFDMLTSCESFFRLELTSAIDFAISFGLDHLFRCVRKNDPDFRVGMVSHDLLNIKPLLLKNFLQILYIYSVFLLCHNLWHV